MMNSLGVRTMCCVPMAHGGPNGSGVNLLLVLILKSLEISFLLSMSRASLLVLYLQSYVRVDPHLVHRSFQFAFGRRLWIHQDRSFSQRLRSSRSADELPS